jgi:hypothetical protein
MQVFFGWVHIAHHLSSVLCFVFVCIHCVLCPMPLNGLFFIVPSVSTNIYVYSNTGVIFKYRPGSAEVRTQRAIIFFLYVFQNIKQCRVSFMLLLCQYSTSIKIQFSTIKSVYVISILLTIVLDGKNAMI